MEIFSSPAYTIAGAALIGVGVGALFFLGLRLTLEKLPGAKRPGLVSILSFFSRAAAAAGGAVVSGRLAGFGGLIAFTAGFLLTKMVILGIARGRKGRTG